MLLISFGILKDGLQLLKNLRVDSRGLWTFGHFSVTEHHEAEDAKDHPQEETEKYCHSRGKPSHCSYIVTSKASWGGALSKVFLRRVGARCKADGAGCLVKLCVVSLEEGASEGQSGA